MANATFYQSNFTAGQISELIHGRTDLSKFYNGVSALENFIPIKQGPVCRRPGTKYVAETKSSQAGSITSSRMVPFQFSTDQTYQLEFGDGYVRFYLNRGRLQDDGTVTLIGSDSDTPFELETPYRVQVPDPTMTSGTFDAAPALSIGALYAYDATRGIVTVSMAAAASHTMSVGNIVLVSDASVPADEIEGVFDVLEVVDSDTLAYAKASGGTTSTTIEFDVPDLVTINTSSAHGLVVGQYIKITGASPSEYNGTYLIETVPTTTSLTFKRDNNGVDPGDISTVGTISMIDSCSSKMFYKQSADVLFMTHPNVKPKELQRKSGFQVISGTYGNDGQGTSSRANLVISTSESPHGFSANRPVLGIHSKVIVSGCTPSEYNGCYTIDSVTENSISYTPGSAPAGPVTVFGTVDGWQIVDFDNQDGPYLDQNTNDSNTLASTISTQAPDNLTSALNTFSQLDEGRLFRVRSDPSANQDWQWAKILWYNAATSVWFAGTDINGVRHPNEDATIEDWRLGAWSSGLGWPRTIGFVQGRSVFGGNAFQDQTIWTSESNNIVSFQPESYLDGSVVADNAITATIDDDQVNSIHWMISVPQGLLIGTENSEYLLEGRANFNPISPTNTVISAQSFIGSKQFVQPVRTGNSSVIFVQRAGRRVYQTLFTIDTESLVPSDITQLAEDITLSGIDSLAFQQEPNPILWACLDDGTLIGCTYETAEEVIAWHKHPIGGTDAEVKSVSVISDTSGSSPVDQLWMIVRRTINGGTVEYVEYMEDQFETGDALEDAFYVDSGVTWTGASTTTIPIGLQLEGETVKVFADGVAVSDKVVDGSGNITLSVAATKVQAGLSFTSKLATLPLEIRQSQPESHEKIKRMERAHVLFINSQDVQFGVDENSLEDVDFDDATSLHSVVIEDMLIQAPYERNQKLWLVNSGVFPTTIGSITIEAEVQPIQS